MIRFAFACLLSWLQAAAPRHCPCCGADLDAHPDGGSGSTCPRCDGTETEPLERRYP